MSIQQNQSTFHKSLFRSTTLFSTILIANLIWVSPISAKQASSPFDRESSTLEQSRADATDVIDSYIVVYKSTSTRTDRDNAKKKAESRGAQVKHQYDTAVQGFSAKMSKTAVAELAQNTAVQYIEPDSIVSVGNTEFALAKTLQTGATWGLDRIDQRTAVLNQQYVYTYTGSNVRAYIIDTGIRLTHKEFGGRATSGYTSINDGNGTNDCHGHGTHVAGTVGGATYGVAKGVKLIAVRALDCSGNGSTSGIVAALDWITKNAVKPAVINMSLSGSASPTMDTAVSNAIKAGISVVVAAGNSNANACYYSPSRVSNALTVGATTKTDARASFSNFGKCLDLFAPGTDITSAGISDDFSIMVASGTSMASPHVAGAVALYLSKYPTASYSTVASGIKSLGTLNIVTNQGTNSPRTLLYTAWP
jgi:subtilisin family serine protease